MLRLKVHVVGKGLKRESNGQDGLGDDDLSCLHRFLYFAKTGQTVGEMRKNIHSQMQKMYPEETDIDINTIKDSKKYDLFDDYLVNDCVENNGIILAVTSRKTPNPIFYPVPVTVPSASRPLLTPLSDSGSVSNTLFVEDKQITKPSKRDDAVKVEFSGSDSVPVKVQKAKRPKVDIKNEEHCKNGKQSTEQTALESADEDKRKKDRRSKARSPNSKENFGKNIDILVQPKQQKEDEPVQIITSVGGEVQPIADPFTHNIAQPLPMKKVEKMAQKAFEDIASIIEKSDSEESSDDEPASLHVPTVRSNSALSITNEGIRPNNVNEDISEEETSNKSKRPSLSELSKGLQQRRNSPTIKSAVVETLKSSQI